MGCLGVRGLEHGSRDLSAVAAVELWVMSCVSHTGRGDERCKRVHLLEVYVASYAERLTTGHNRRTICNGGKSGTSYAIIYVTLDALYSLRLVSWLHGTHLARHQIEQVSSVCCASRDHKVGES